MTKSSILPVTITLETENDVQLFYELISRVDINQVKELCNISTQEAHDIYWNIQGICDELEEAGYDFNNSSLNLGKHSYTE